MFSLFHWWGLIGEPALGGASFPVTWLLIGSMQLPGFLVVGVCCPEAWLCSGPLPCLSQGGQQPLSLPRAERVSAQQWWLLPHLH